MNERSEPTPLRGFPLRLLVPLAALAAMAAFAGRDADPNGTAEGIYLAVLVAAALLPVAGLAPAPALELGLGAVLAAAALWALPPGPERGAAVLLVLVASLAVAAVRRLLQTDGELPPAVAVPLALGAQVLLRGELLFAPALSGRTLVALLALPVAGALAVAALARSRGAVPALLAGATAISLAPGFNVASTLALLALAAGDLAGRSGLRPAVRIAALAVVLAPIAWEPGTGLVTAACGLALARPRLGLPLAVVVAASLTALFRPSPDALLLHFAALPLLVPAAVAPDRRGVWNVLAAAPLVAAVPLVPDLSAMAAPLALAALAVRPDPAFTVPQRVWTGSLLAGTALLAAYPWMRPEPLTAALSLLGLLPGPGLAVWAVAVFLALAGLGVWMGRGWGEPLRSARLAGLSAAGLAFALLLGLPGRGTPLLPPELPVVLDAGHPAWESALPREPMGSLVVESSLANGAALPPGTPVATLRLRDGAGRSVDWTLRAGQDTGEVAARRPDVARTGTVTPPAWISWVADGFFAQRYRSRLRLGAQARFERLRVERAPGVPPDLEVAVYQLEVRR